MTATPHRYEVTESTLAYQGRVISVRRDQVRMPDGDISQRDVVVHPGAVGVVALDEADRVVMVHQYRHPVGGPLWELPAGILDVPGEPASSAAARELAEEAGLRADRYDLLVDVWASPGMTDEAYRLFLARGLHEIPAAERYVPVHEEAEMGLARIDFTDAVERVLRGEITNAMAVIGLLATARARAENYAGLRPPDAPWPARPAHRG
ncbi:ADP-ribose pyrophosphatase [Frankia sp. CcI156]|uniref:NUDIX hydrolase n=1 Tax=Frankia casuarinae (strain DSM 45818 / CECT 9043 / HFP020203 / CcI3) TaxID=106370 RepID=Q2J879_FRACC|nr:MULTISPECIES: NUDIX hydrolase [Frankia]ABD12513.1 NUDIX hydrolase [Frankia casuarinae]ETA00436.1 NTP pyrophosphohydrolase [Frankia sp. CcI6]EYT90258.1 NTP pyrophosphohydrolase [Frankia casuarinae]KDA42304.1 NTP pyrophosphohydrolase [Frankia sp. BMG5.23]KFB05017.1 NTP pyrophosphohydrolase [Frankia sp. Allo2]